MERTFSMMKPDSTAQNCTGAINAMIEEKGFRIIAQKRIRMSQEVAERFYAVHKGKPFYEKLIKLMTSGPVVVQVLEKENALEDYRALMGATDPKDAAPDTIRGRFGSELPANAIHGSDSPETAEREISFFFNQMEIVG